MVLRNLIPIVLIAALIALGLWRAEKAMVTAFTVFGKIVVAIVTVGLAAAIVESLTGVCPHPRPGPPLRGLRDRGSPLPLYWPEPSLWCMSSPGF